jgi:hypothetical protein
MSFWEFASWLKEFPGFPNANSTVPHEVHGLEHLDRLYKLLGVEKRHLITPRLDIY